MYLMYGCAFGAPGSPEFRAQPNFTLTPPFTRVKEGPTLTARGVLSEHRKDKQRTERLLYTFKEHISYLDVIYLYDQTMLDGEGHNSTL